MLAGPFDGHAPSGAGLDAKALGLYVHGWDSNGGERSILVGYSRRDRQCAFNYNGAVAKQTKPQERILGNDDLWEIECLQRQFPEHSLEEILWAFNNCKGEREDPAALTKCIKRRLKR